MYIYNILFLYVSFTYTQRAAHIWAARYVFFLASNGGDARGAEMPTDQGQYQHATDDNHDIGAVR